MNADPGMILLGGVCFIVGAIAFVAVFSYLAAKFDYPSVLDGDAAEVLPRLRRRSIGATFKGLNLHLGNYIGEFLGEISLGGFFLLSGFALLDETRFPGWLGRCGIAFGVLFIVGAFRNVTPRVQWISSLNNVLLPLWMIVLGGSLIAWAP